MSSAERHAHDSDDSVGALVTRASQQLSELVREEMQLARAEMTAKGKRFGVGGGLFGGAGLTGFLAAQALTGAGIAAVALLLPLWASALIVAAVLAAAAAVMAMVGKKQIANAGPPVPGQTVDSVKADVAEIKEKTQR
ncbi:phage holin family protein [Streptomyces sp. H27-C3]|uniref:phage holin family protein n=1 Tax=Streptomyces sp. H27-C3 TaxID=3046305 RepID=UPI0024BBD0F3|nr:phage holin family protein [Streptomyces sp. H27-C3]MDJ0466284.1 phage holin family protein [Streptomyces sp. H27-C3]